MASIDQLNSTVFPLEPSQIYIGTYSSTTNYSEVCSTIETDSTFQLTVNYSSNGVDLGIQKVYTQLAVSTEAIIYNLPPLMRYVQILLQNTSESAQTYLRLQSIFKPVQVFSFTAGTGTDVNVTNPELNVNIVNSSLPVNISNFPAVQEVSGSVSANITNSSLIVDVSGANFTSGNLNTIDTNSNKIYGCLNTSGFILLWANTLVLENATSSSITPYLKSSIFTFFGNSSNATILTVQLSYDSTNFYDSQYSYTLTSGGNFGFTLNLAGVGYIRLKTSAGTTITAYCNFN